MNRETNSRHAKIVVGSYDSNDIDVQPFATGNLLVPSSFPGGDILVLAAPYRKTIGGQAIEGALPPFRPVKRKDGTLVRIASPSVDTLHEIDAVALVAGALVFRLVDAGTTTPAAAVADECDLVFIGKS